MDRFLFELPLSIDEKDVNDHHHVSYDRYFVLFEEARIAYLATLGFRSGGTPEFGLIAAEARCSYRKELTCGDRIVVRCRIGAIGVKSFDMLYRIFRGASLCAEGAATFLCFDYAAKRVGRFPERLLRSVREYEGL